MNNEMLSLMNLTYEIEGLMLLLINRGDEAPEDMKQLLRRKVSQLAMALGDDGVRTMTAPATLPVSNAPADSETATEPAEREEEANNEAEIDSEIAANVAFEEENDAFEAPQEAATQPLPETPGCTVTPEVKVELPSVASLQPEKCHQLTVEEKVARESASDFSKAFTLNDKFRFVRELFNGSEKEFAETLDVVASMSSMDEASEYFYDDLCWDPDSPEVKEFMEIVARHF